MPTPHRTAGATIAAAIALTGLLAGCAGSPSGSAAPTPMESVPVGSSATTPAPTVVTSSPTSPVTASSTTTPAPSPTRAATTKPAKPPCPQTSRQRDLEVALAAIGAYGSVVVDGTQSATDCATIKRFQRRMGIYPVNGVAGPTTTNVAKRIAATDTSACKAGTATMACVDLTHQTFYVMRGGKVVLGPTVARTGKPGYATPDGTFSIFERAKSRWSTPYKVWMPYWQQFYSGDGLHETTTYIHDMSVGSHGCVNLLHTDAVSAYSLLSHGSKVRLYGRRPGT